MKPFSNLPPARIVVIGGNGETGRRILRMLRARHPTLILTSASRRAAIGDHLPPDVRHIAIDMRDSDSAIAVLRQFDLAILALGPMNAFAATPHALCLQAGIDCIDINDNLDAADAILALDSEASRAGRRILTGMGLAPGLSTLLLMQLARELASPSGTYRSRFYAGAAYGGGESSPHAILDSFRSQRTCLTQGQRCQESTPRRDARHQFHFPGQREALPLIPYSSPEIAGLASARRRTGCAAIATLDARYHIQFLSPGMASLFARLDRGRGMRQRLARLFYSNGQSIKRRKNADPDCSLWVYPDDRPQDGLLVHGGISSYDFTAAMACAAVETMLDRALDVQAGAHAVEHLPDTAHAALSAALRSHGVTYRRASDLQYQRDPLHFGWCQIVADKGEDWPHYAQCWYDIALHPRMSALQTRYLTESALWRQLKASLSPLGLARFVARVMLHWRRHYIALAPMRKRHATQAGHWARITRDISMFTAGYSQARALLGQEQAFTLYRRMFLDTGRMEMRWLWPMPEVVAESASPEVGIRAYWQAFAERCRELGLLSGNSTAQGYDVAYCAYADMFGQLECPELGNLVREMECEALTYMASASRVRIDWRQEKYGRASIRIETASLADTEARGRTTGEEACPPP